MTINEKIIKNKVGLLRLAEELGNVSKAWIEGKREKINSEGLALIKFLYEKEESSKKKFDFKGT